MAGGGGVPLNECAAMRSEQRKKMTHQVLNRAAHAPNSTRLMSHVLCCVRIVLYRQDAVEVAGLAKLRGRTW